MVLNKIFYFTIKRIFALYLILYALYNLSRTNAISSNGIPNLELIESKVGIPNILEFFKKNMFMVIATGNLAIFYGAILLIFGAGTARLFLTFGFIIDLILNSKYNLEANEEGFNRFIGYIAMVGLCLDI